MVSVGNITSDRIMPLAAEVSTLRSRSSSHAASLTSVLISGVLQQVDPSRHGTTRFRDPFMVSPVLQMLPKMPRSSCLATCDAASAARSSRVPCSAGGIKALSGTVQGLVEGGVRRNSLAVYLQWAI